MKGVSIDMRVVYVNKGVVVVVKCYGPYFALVLYFFFYFVVFFFFNDTATTEISTILFVGSVRCV